jgi:hypothetical protein
MLIRIAQVLLIVLFLVWTTIGSFYGPSITVGQIGDYSTLITAIGTIIIAVFTGTLWLATDKLREAGEKQAKLTKILERAYIAAEPLGINPYISDDGSIHEQVIGHVGFVNVGRLPARNVVIIQPKIVWCNRILKEKDLELTPTLPLNVVVPPGTKMPFGTQAYSTEYLEKGGFLYVRGEIRYADGFGKPRFTKSCHRYPCRAHEVAPDGSMRIDAKHARYHDYGNDAD